MILGLHGRCHVCERGRVDDITGCHYTNKERVLDPARFCGSILQ